jgi:predicted DNA-binding protein
MGRPPLKRNVATVMLSVRLPADLVERIDASIGEKTRGEFMREAIERELRRLKSRPPTDRD